MMSEFLHEILQIKTRQMCREKKMKLKIFRLMTVEAKR